MDVDRRGFLEAATRGISDLAATGGNLACLLIDLNGFRQINFAFGIETGDKVLAESLRRMHGVLRDGDVMRRVGDDEFALLLCPVINEDHVQLAVHRMLAQLTQPLNANGHEIHLRATVGVVVRQASVADPETLLVEAGMALSHARRTGVGVASYEAGKLQRSEGKSVSESELREAVSRGQLEIYYQPQVSIADGSLCGAEALLRWNHPRHGLLAPADFISLAEQSELMNDVTYWVVNAAMRQRRAWEKQGWEVRVSVNVSPRTLMDPDMPELVRRALDTWSVDPTAMTLEFTETVLMRLDDSTRQRLGRLRDWGLRLAIDDFGHGYSSFAYLSELFMQELKIDQRFVNGLEQSQRNQSVVRAIVEIGHTFGMEVVAEGVETEACLGMLAQLGCDIAQGYFFSEPIPEAQLSGRLQSRGILH